jgi:hypothetical protein
MAHHLIHLGMQRSGSTFLYQLLRQSSAISATPQKELVFFKHSPDRSYASYLTHFDTSKPVTFENSPVYFRSGELIAPRIAEALRGRPVTLSLVLRNPITYLKSHYELQARRAPAAGAGARDRSSSLLELLQRNPDYLDRCRYAHILESSWLREFPREAIEIFFFEEFVAAPREVVGRLMAVCGAGSTEEISLEGAFTNAEPKAAWVEKAGRLLRRYPQLRRGLSGVTGNARVRDFVFKLGYKAQRGASTIDADDGAEVDDYIRDAVQQDMDRLRDLVGRDRLPWAEFQDKGSREPMVDSETGPSAPPRGR